MVKNDDQKNKSHIAYYVTIDMELHPGTSLTPEELKNIKCRQKWNAVKKSYADFRGKSYVIPPVYQQPKQPNRNNTINNKPAPNNQSRKNRAFNRTRKQNNANIRGGNKNMTVRKL
jgi:hypothetical protein